MKKAPVRIPGTHESDLTATSFVLSLALRPGGSDCHNRKNGTHRTEKKKWSQGNVYAVDIRGMMAH
jgi:hypothetical protein